MNKLLFTILLLLISNLANANSVKSRLKEEFGSCYEYFDNNLFACRPSSCTYPDLNDSKAWKAKTIVGMNNDKCYVMYYSYIGQKVINEPDHCFYNKSQLKMLANTYNMLFQATTSIQAAELKEKINYLTYLDCKKKDEQNK